MHIVNEDIPCVHTGCLSRVHVDSREIISDFKKLNVFHKIPCSKLDLQNNAVGDFTLLGSGFFYVSKAYAQILDPKKNSIIYVGNNEGYKNGGLQNMCSNSIPVKLPFNPLFGKSDLPGTTL